LAKLHRPGPIVDRVAAAIPEWLLRSALRFSGR
jgi:hypothetical protein